jgi:sorting nexin-25
VLESVVGRRYLTQFLEQVGSASLMGYWGAVEELRQSKRCNWHQLGAEIFYTYINTPSPDIKVDKVNSVIDPHSLCVVIHSLHKIIIKRNSP